jgi:hypothetical protein
VRQRRQRAHHGQRLEVPAVKEPQQQLLQAGQQRGGPLGRWARLQLRRLGPLLRVGASGWRRLLALPPLRPLPARRLARCCIALPLPLPLPACG